MRACSERLSAFTAAKTSERSDADHVIYYRLRSPHRFARWSSPQGKRSSAHVHGWDERARSPALRATEIRLATRLQQQTVGNSLDHSIHNYIGSRASKKLDYVISRKLVVQRLLDPLKRHQAYTLTRA